MIPCFKMIFVAALAGALASPAARAHGGDDHAHPAPTAVPVSQGASAAGQAAREPARRQADGAVFVPKSAQR
ncbi:hypothetical protein, partial [Proteus terrae]